MFTVKFEMDGQNVKKTYNHEVFVDSRHETREDAEKVVRGSRYISLILEPGSAPGEQGRKGYECLRKIRQLSFRDRQRLRDHRTTSSRSGYPEGLKWALTSFEDWAEAEEAAKALDGEIISLRRRDGQQLWTRDGRVFEPYTRTPESDDEEIWPGGEQSAREYWDGERVALADALQRGELDAEGLAAWSGKISRAIEEIADADDEQGVITRRGEFVEVIDLRPMSYHDGDVTAYQIAVILCG